MPVKFRIIAASTRYHAALGNLSMTLFGRELGHHPERSGFTAIEAYQRTTCHVCRHAFHPDIRRRIR